MSRSWPARMYLTAPRTAAVALAVSAIVLMLLSRRSALPARYGALQEEKESSRREALVASAGPVSALAKDVKGSPASPAMTDLAVAGADSGPSLAVSASHTSWTSGSTASSAMIIRTGTASIEVASVDSALPRVRLLAAQVGGYIANSAIQGGHEQVRSATIEIKTPAQNFERLMSGLAPIGKLEYVNVNAEDVGEEYVDIDARVTNDHRLEERLIQLLATRTGKLKDVLDVERELARVREEVERYEGRLRFLRTRAAVSTLSISVHEPVPIIANTGPSPIAAAAREAWHNFVGLLALTVASLGVVIPVGAVAATVWLVFRRRSRAASAPVATPAPGGD